MLGPLAAADYEGPLIAWISTVIRLRRHPGRQSAPFPEDPWCWRPVTSVTANSRIRASVYLGTVTFAAVLIWLRT
ncbi:hypothetical protein GCM10010272_31140 [Streptomyces lateritius]|nr:hypothetical protein GCM10010272_31140 [Streptomyces lateritius]